MTAASLAIFVGCTGQLRSGDLWVDIRIKDARKVWDRTDFLVTPAAGTGEQWVSADRVNNLDTPAVPS
jgi:hypothetical protein